MNPDKHLGVGLIIFGAVALAMTLIFFIGFSSLTRPMIVEGQSSISSYTSNSSSYEAFSLSFTAIPLLVVLIFGGMVVFGGWQLLKRIVKGPQG